MADCPNLTTCIFVQKFSQTKDLAVAGFINLYCKGPKQNECKRKEYKQKNGTVPPAEMLPTGHMMAGTKSKKEE